MYLNKLSKTKPGDYIKHLACRYLERRYGKHRDFFWYNIEEKVIDGKYYYTRIDEEGKNDDIRYLFTDYNFACNKEYISAFDKGWIELVYRSLYNLSPKLASRYFLDLDKEMSREIAPLKEKRL